MYYIYIYIYIFFSSKNRGNFELTFLRCEAVVVSTWEVRPSTRWIQDSVPQPQTRKGAKQGGRTQKLRNLWNCMKWCHDVMMSWCHDVILMIFWYFHFIIRIRFLTFSCQTKADLPLDRDGKLLLYGTVEFVACRYPENACDNFEFRWMLLRMVFWPLWALWISEALFVTWLAAQCFFCYRGKVALHQTISFKNSNIAMINYHYDFWCSFLASICSILP